MDQNSCDAFAGRLDVGSSPAMRLEKSQPTDGYFCALQIVRKADLPFVFTNAQKALYFLASCRVLLDREECERYPQVYAGRRG